MTSNDSTGVEMLSNRIRKRERHLRRWVRRQEIDAWRLYDADLPEFAFAVDVYGDHLHVQEYAAPAPVAPGQAHARLEEALKVLPELLGIPRERIHVKVRSRQRGSAQYERVARQGGEFEVREGPCRLLVNLTDYLDTGLFLDHRTTRALLREEAAGKRLLNLFCYTATVTVHAAVGGAPGSVSVDLSQTYLDWARRNFDCNGIDANSHQLVQADCIEWLAGPPQPFDLVFLDPPTFSNSKRMQRSFDVQRDHVPLLRAASRWLAPGGTLWFSTNRRRFHLDAAALGDLEVRDVTAATIPKDFERTPTAHRCWLIRHRSTEAG